MPSRFIPKQPDPYLKRDEDMAPAKFGHLNEILRMTQREYADDTAAKAAGLKVGELYSQPTGAVHVVKP
jgi:hypothetical protein